MINNIILDDAEEICKHIDFAKLSGKTILITGASGLVGVYFIACLNRLSQKFQFKTVAVIQSEPVPFFKELLDYPQVTVCRGDITSEEFCHSLPKADFIIHASGYGQPGKFLENPDKTLRMNTFSTFLLFDKLNAEGSFLFVSSTEVYSGLKSFKYTEEEIGISNTTHPRACYIEGKRGGEAIANAYRTKGFKTNSARLAHTFGPGTRPGDKRVIMSFIEKALQGQIEMLDKGKALRTYCYVSDAVRMMWNILLYGKEPIYNVAGNSQTSIANLARIIGKELSIPVIFPEQENGLSGAPEDVQLEMSKFENEFGHLPLLGLEEGLKRTVNWYKKTYYKDNE